MAGQGGRLCHPGGGGRLCDGLAGLLQRGGGAAPVRDPQPANRPGLPGLVSRRRLYLDAAPGEMRGVVTLDGLPERLLIQRSDDSPVQALGARVIGRVRKIERPLASLFIDLGEGPDAVLALNGPAAGLAEGAAIELEI